MDLIQLSNEETKCLEENSTSIEIVTLMREPYSNLLLDIQLWYYPLGLTALEPHYKLIDVLSYLVGYKPNYDRLIKKHKTSVWGFEWNGEKFTIKKSKSGTDIHISNNFTKNKKVLKTFLEELADQLGNKGVHK